MQHKNYLRVYSANNSFFIIMYILVFYFEGQLKWQLMAR